MAHTPGPWTRKDNDIVAMKPSIFGRTREVAIARVLNDAVYGSGDPEVDYNALLIMAAPDLLVALETLYDRCEEMRLNYTDPAGVGSAMSIVEVAIAKARGGR